MIVIFEEISFIAATVWVTTIPLSWASLAAFCAILSVCCALSAFCWMFETICSIDAETSSTDPACSEEPCDIASELELSSCEPDATLAAAWVTSPTTRAELPRDV